MPHVEVSPIRCNRNPSWGPPRLNGGHHLIDAVSITEMLDEPWFNT